jgi:hypothetical protein
VALLLALGALLVASANAFAVSGAGFTTINSTADGGGTGADEGLCHNGNGNVNCNQYFSKRFVWINGGPDKNGLSDGTYFFAVLVPGTQQDPNDQPPNTFPKPRTDGNLSDDFDPYTNRTFTVTNGEISAYSGTHDFGTDTADNNEKKIRLFPYSDTTNNGGVYILAICQLQETTKNGVVTPAYPVDPKDCKYDAFKIQEDHTPPTCPRPTFSINSDGLGQADQTISDPGGIDSITISSIVNLNVTPITPGVNWFMGTTSAVHITATEIVRGAGSRIRITVTDVGGNTSECDPVLARVRARSGRHAAIARTYRVTQRENRVVIRNGKPGLSRMVIKVNGKRIVVRHLKRGEKRVVSIKRALKQGTNKVTLRGHGKSGGSAAVMIAN